MPIYEYKCPRCGVKFEILRGISSVHEDLKCPKCGAEKPERIFSAACGISHDINKGNLRFPT